MEMLDEQNKEIRKNICVMGCSGVGKTSIRAIIFGSWTPAKTKYFEPTLEIATSDINFFGISVTIKDCGGQNDLIPEYFNQKQKEVFSNLEIFVFVIEAEKRTEQTKNQNNQNIQNTENSESARQQIIEEIDTTIPKKNIVGENVEKQGDIIIQSFSPNTICHRLIPKGSDLDISQKAHFKCYKIKTKSNIISFITGSKKIVVPYIIFIDENYYYMAKDKIVNQKNPNLRRIGNKYDLLKLSNFQTTKKGDDYEFAFEFVNEDIFDRTFKLLYFTPKEAEDFYAVLHTILGGFNIEIPENLDDDNEEEEEDDEEGEEIEDDGQEEGEAGDDAEGKNQIEVKVDEKEKDEIENNSEEKNNDNNKKSESNEDTKEGTTMSTKEENKETRDVEIIAQ